MDKTPQPIDHLLTWAYQREAIGNTADNWRLGYGQVSADGIAAVERNALYGGRIDGGGLAKMVSDRENPDALELHWAVMALPRNQCFLVLQYARAGFAPDWMPGAESRPVPFLSGGGRPIVETRRGTRGRQVPFKCRLRYEPEPGLIENRREIYRSWWDSVTRLYWLFRENPDRLKRWAARPASTPREPWIEET